MPRQGNNSYIFPGVGLGVIVSGASRVTDDMFMAAAHALAAQVREDDLRAGQPVPAALEHSRGLGAHRRSDGCRRLPQRPRTRRAARQPAGSREIADVRAALRHLRDELTEPEQEHSSR